jgi:hypothetical protein
MYLWIWSSEFSASSVYSDKESVVFRPDSHPQHSQEALQSQQQRLCQQRFLDDFERNGETEELGLLSGPSRASSLWAIYMLSALMDSIIIA